MIRVRPLLLLVLPLLMVLAACGSGADEPTDTTTGACSYPKGGVAASKKVDLPPSDPPTDNPETVTMSVESGEVSGDIRIALEPAHAPCAVNSFLSLADQGYFDDTRCHRLTTEGYFVLQCGDPSGTGRGAPGYTFADELVPDDPRLQPCGQEGGQDYCTYNTGTVAMANAGPDTNGSQFFLVYGNSKFPPDYTVLGHMDAAGLKVVNEIAAQGIDPASASADRPGDGAPKEPVTITSVKATK